MRRLSIFVVGSLVNVTAGANDGDLATLAGSTVNRIRKIVMN